MTVQTPELLTEQEARRLTERAKAAFRNVLGMHQAMDEPLCGPAPDFRRIGTPSFLAILADPALKGDPELVTAALASAQWRAAHPGRHRGASLSGHVYFIQDEDGYIKIGFAVSVADRIKTLQTGSRQELRILATMAGTPKDERKLHRRFRTDHVRGEWFYPSDDLCDFIEEVSR